MPRQSTIFIILVLYPAPHRPCPSTVIFFPEKKALKEFFDANPIEQMNLETARKTYDRCVKHHLGCFVPGHHPHEMFLQELVPKLKIELRDILFEYPRAEKQSANIKKSLEEIVEARKHILKRLYLHKDFPIQHLVGLTKDQLEAMIHNHYVKDRKTPPDFKFTSKESLMMDFRYEVFLLKQNANELNVPAKSTSTDVEIEYVYSDSEMHGCDGYIPRTLVITPKFPLKCLPALTRNQMEAMLQNHYCKHDIEVPTFDNMSDNVLRSRIHLAVCGPLPSHNTSLTQTGDAKRPSHINTSQMPIQPTCPSPTKKQRHESKSIDEEMDDATKVENPKIDNNQCPPSNTIESKSYESNSGANNTSNDPNP